MNRMKVGLKVFVASVCAVVLPAMAALVGQSQSHVPHPPPAQPRQASTISSSNPGGILEGALSVPALPILPLNLQPVTVRPPAGVQSAAGVVPPTLTGGAPAAPEASGTASTTPSTPPSTAQDAVPASSLVAQATGATVGIAASPGGPSVNVLFGTNPVGQPQTFLVVGTSDGWYQVLLPTKPDGSTGWVQAGQVRISSVDGYLRVYLSSFRMQYWVGGHLAETFTVGVGKPSTPTPPGMYYVWASELVNQQPYAPGIMALSGFSHVLPNWPGGGRLGIHGWSNLQANGTAASYGCVHMEPADFSRLYGLIPLGTPVEILP